MHSLYNIEVVIMSVMGHDVYKCRLIKYSKAEYARIGIMPRYGNADSIKWFQVESNCIFHLLNCFEDGTDEVVVRACRALDSVIPGPNTEDESLFSRVYEWRLNMNTGDVRERFLTGTEFSMDFPMIHGDFTGVKNKYGYTQVNDSNASSDSGMPKYGGLAKLYFEEPADNKINSQGGQSEELMQVEYHKFEQNTFCTGAAFVPKQGSHEEEDGWIITFVHNEDTSMSKVGQFCTLVSNNHMTQ
ncbi:BETA-CAROTENE DIOXYGENASE [Salix purpurea]|uniref:BETA-CAROTENE DIOXYGENASE n=1 Tax=Salix purpurea TaxID=77065 RepID=A0A9Q0UMD5_SALPP|nr:BETA-CAROTENE DIOXYGENASE [Salix purpurea]